VSELPDLRELRAGATGAAAYLDPAEQCAGNIAAGMTPRHSPATPPWRTARSSATAASASEPPTAL
jgi:hypothetical protein